MMRKKFYKRRDCDAVAGKQIIYHCPNNYTFTRNSGGNVLKLVTQRSEFQQDSNKDFSFGIVIRMEIFRHSC